jgi:small subunit ribosomal protein S6
MRTYELTFIVDAQLAPERQETVINDFLEQLKNQGMEIVNIEKWGKRKLAYPIDDHQYGHYVMTQFKAEAGAFPEIERHLKLTPHIIRHLILYRDPKTLRLMQMETERLAREAMRSTEPSAPAPKEQPPKVEQAAPEPETVSEKEDTIAEDEKEEDKKETDEKE